jgi:hypothetical protein
MLRLIMSEKGDGPQRNNPDSFNDKKVGIGSIHTSGDKINRQETDYDGKKFNELPQEEKDKVIADLAAKKWKEKDISKKRDNVIKGDFGGENSPEKTED